VSCNLQVTLDSPDVVATRHDSPVSTPLERALARVGDRWTLLVVEALLDGPRRFGELGEAVPGIAPNILAARLRKLESEQLVVSTPYSTRPVRHHYELTADGRELATALAVLGSWAAHVDSTVPGVPYHDVCGTPLELRPWCPTCGRLVDDADADELDRL
jgi:DNA-binding HxlR family transcriptional regulator